MNNRWTRIRLFRVRAALHGRSAAGLVAQTPAPVPEPLTLRHAVELALARAPGLAAARAAREEGAASAELARDAFSPSAYFSTTPGYTYGLPTLIAGHVPSIFGVEIQKPIFDPMRRSAALRAEASASSLDASLALSCRATMEAAVGRVRPFVPRRGAGRGRPPPARGRRRDRPPRDRPLRGGPPHGARSRERDAPGRAGPAEAPERRVGPGPRRARAEAPDRLAGERAAAPRGRSRSRRARAHREREPRRRALGGPRARVARAGGHASREVREHRVETLDADGRRFGRVPAAREIQQLRRLLPDLHARLRGGRRLDHRADLDRRPLRGRKTARPGPASIARRRTSARARATSRWPSGGPRPPSPARWPSGAFPAGRGGSPTARRAPRSCSSARDGASSSSSTSGRWPWPTPTTRPLRRAWTSLLERVHLLSLRGELGTALLGAEPTCAAP